MIFLSFALADPGYCQSVVCGFVQFFVFPPLCHRFGVLNCYRAAAMIFPFIYLITPYTAVIQDDTWRYVFFMLIMLVKGFVVIIGFPCTTILLTNSASSLRVLGTLNGFATSFSGLGRALGPAMTGAVFSLGVKKGYMIFPWWLLAAVAFLGAIPAWFIVEGDGPSGKPVEEVEDDIDEEGGALLGEGGAILEAAADGPNTLLRIESQEEAQSGYKDGEDPDDVLPVRRFRNAHVFDEPDDPASDSDGCPTPLCPELKNSPKGARIPPQVRLRRMSTTGPVGHQVEHSADDVD